jgi:hypothetical protein
MKTRATKRKGEDFTVLGADAVEVLHSGRQVLSPRWGYLRLVPGFSSAISSSEMRICSLTLRLLLATTSFPPPPGEISG